MGVHPNTSCLSVLSYPKPSPDNKESPKHQPFGASCIYINLDIQTPRFDVDCISRQTGR